MSKWQVYRSFWSMWVPVTADRAAELLVEYGLRVRLI